MAEAILQINNISLSFGGVKAIENISFDVKDGEICAVVGPNGAGKSSMLNVINGIYTAQEGSITFDGTTHQKMTTSIAAKAGIARTFQNIALFKGMNVVENIMTGRNMMTKTSWMAQGLNLPSARREEAEHREAVEKIISFLQIEAIRKTQAASLPYGLQKRVELARAIAAEPRMLLLDEPMAGMNLEEKQDMSCFILEINREFDLTTVLIEHDIGVVMDISDHVVVLDYGKKIGDGTPDEVVNNQDVIDAYLGVSHD